MEDKYIIFYDMDEVLNLMSKKAIDEYNKEFDDNYDWKNNKSWAWEDAPKGNAQFFMDKMNSPGFFYETEPQYDAIFYMERLIKEGYDVRILTRPIWNGLCTIEKEEWIKKYLPFFDIEKTNYCKDKWLMAKKKRILLDDNVTNLEMWEKHGGISIAYTHNFNLEWQGKRVDSHEDFYKTVKKITKD